MNQSNAAIRTVDLHELALLILGQDHFLHPDGRDGSIIASGGQTWRYRDGKLHEVAWHEYEAALSSSDRSDWPPYTIDFTIAPETDCALLKLTVTTVYDQGICAESRGGNETRWIVQYVDDQWQTDRLDYVMSWD